MFSTSLFFFSSFFLTVPIMPKLSFTAASKKGANCRLGYLVILHAVCWKTEKCSREEHLSALAFIFSARRLCFPCPSPSATLYVSGRPHVMKSWRDVWARRVRKSSSQPPPLAPSPATPHEGGATMSAFQRYCSSRTAAEAMESDSQRAFCSVPPPLQKRKKTKHKNPAFRWDVTGVKDPHPARCFVFLFCSERRYCCRAEKLTRLCKCRTGLTRRVIALT